MTVWREIEEALSRWEIPLQVTLDEKRMIQEALAFFIRDHVTENSVWDLIEATTKIVPGLDASEADLLKKQWSKIANTPLTVKPGHNGMVVAMPTDAWHTVLRQLQTNRDYFAGQMRGRGNIDNLIQKIGKAVGTDSVYSPDEHDLSGDPADITPTEARPTTFNDPSVGGEYPIRGSSPASTPKTPFASREAEREFSPEELGGGSVVNASEEERRARERRARVAAQDRAMMGGNTKPIGKVKVR